MGVDEHFLFPRAALVYSIGVGSFLEYSGVRGSDYRNTKINGKIDGKIEFGGAFYERYV